MRAASLPGPNRNYEQALAETIVVLADALVDDYDVVDLLDRLVTACVDLLGVTAAGLLLDDQKGHLAVAASTSEETRLLEIFQLQNNEGPCLDCFRTGTAVTSGDLRSDRARWPQFVPAALATSASRTQCPHHGHGLRGAALITPEATSSN